MREGSVEAMDIQQAQFKANLLRLNREELLAIFYMSKRCGEL